MRRDDFVLRGEEFSEGNERACHTLERLCEDNKRDTACRYLPE
jgi:hypothetical protein